MNRYYISQWSIVIFIFVALAALGIIYRKSAIYLLISNPIPYEVFNGQAPPQLLIGKSFNGNIAAQVKRIPASKTQPAYQTCLTAFGNNPKTLSTIFHFVAQANPTDLNVMQTPTSFVIAMPIQAAIPFEIKYFFSINNKQYTLDSITQVDKLLLNFKMLY